MSYETTHTSYGCRKAEVKMKIKVNGKSVVINDAVNVLELLKSQNAESIEYVTVQINDEFISNDDFETEIIKDGDIVEFLYFMGGGSEDGIF